MDDAYPVYDHAGEQSCAWENYGDDEFVVHHQSKPSAFRKVALGIAIEGLSEGLIALGGPTKDYGNLPFIDIFAALILTPTGSRSYGKTDQIQ